MSDESYSIHPSGTRSAFALPSCCNSDRLYPCSPMIKLPSKEGITAVDAALQPYFMALGRVAHSWNHLHEELGKVFCAVVKLDLSVGMAIWHSLRSDRSQRDILDAAIIAVSGDEDWTDAHPKALKGVCYLLKETQKVANRRNNAIHAPCTVLPGTLDFEIKP